MTEPEALMIWLYRPEDENVVWMCEVLQNYKLRKLICYDFADMRPFQLLPYTHTCRYMRRGIVYCLVYDYAGIYVMD